MGGKTYRRQNLPICRCSESLVQSHAVSSVAPPPGGPTSFAPLGSDYLQRAARAICWATRPFQASERRRSSYAVEVSLHLRKLTPLTLDSFPASLPTERNCCACQKDFPLAPCALQSARNSAQTLAVDLARGSWPVCAASWVFPCLPAGQGFFLRRFRAPARPKLCAVEVLRAHTQRADGRFLECTRRGRRAI